MPPALIFDLDGTLIDSAPAIHAVSNAVLTAHGFAPLSFDAVRSYVGKGAPHLVRCLLEASGENPDGPMFDKLYQELVTRYETEVEGNALYPGVIEALVSLRAMGCALAVTTNKPLAPALAAMRHVGIEALFDVILGGDSLPSRKPDPEMVHEASRRLGRENVLYIGDSEVDCETAQNARLPFVLYTEGYRKTPVEALPHAAIYSDYKNLRGIVEGWTWL